MAGKSRKISFYLLVLEKKVPIQGSRQTRFVPLTKNEIDEHFKNIYDNKMQLLSNGNKAITVTLSNGADVVEVLEFSNHRAFVKVGQQNPSNTVALRNQATLETEDVPMSENQLLELFTYCFIDFETGIISYISISGAPRVSTIRAMFDHCFLYTENVTTKLAAIMIDDIAAKLSHKHTISKLEIEVAVPSNRILSDLGVNPAGYDALKNVRTRTATYEVISHRNKNMFEDERGFLTLIGDLKSSLGESLLKLRANAKAENEPSQTYDLLQYSFTKTVNLERENIETIGAEEFKEILAETYTQSKDELLRYCHS